jgi:hypothetical protein
VLWFMLGFQFNDKHIPLYTNTAFVSKAHNKLIKTVSIRVLQHSVCATLKGEKLLICEKVVVLMSPCPFNNLIQDT